MSRRPPRPSAGNDVTTDCRKIGAELRSFPNGDKVAWFLDPDGNILSLSQLA